MLSIREDVAAILAFVGARILGVRPRGFDDETAGGTGPDPNGESSLSKTPEGVSAQG